MKNIIMAFGILGASIGLATQAFAGYFNPAPIMRCDVEITRTLQFGSRNSEVRTLQDFLSRAGYLEVAPNGYFGPSTRSAVRNFQSDNQLSRTGTVGESTRNAINERLCDSDVIGDSSYDDGYTSNSGVTYVDAYDPNAVVVSPRSTNPAIYATPQNNVQVSHATYSSNHAVISTQSNQTISNATSPYLREVQEVYGVTSVASQPIVSAASIPAISAQSSFQVAGTGIMQNPNGTYSVGITQRPGSITIASPRANQVYKEGDTVNVQFSASNLNVSGYRIILENSSIGQSKVVALVSNSDTRASFVLSRELLDAVCGGSCNGNQQKTFRVVISTPVTDIAGNTTLFNSAVAPITIVRPTTSYSVVTLTSSKTPVNSGESFKVYMSTPGNGSTDTAQYANYTVKLHAICPSSVTAVIAGASCGQDIVVPLSLIASSLQEIPAKVTNPTWFKQDVIFEAIVINGTNQQVVGTARVSVPVNATAISW